MKKLLIFILLTCATTTAIEANISTKETKQYLYSGYCQGWEDGFCEGWKEVKGPYAVCPIPPPCPIPEIGKDKYRDGYNRGFITGIRAANG